MNKRFLLRLYPRQWRERYGEEFLALVEGEGVRPRLILDVARAAVGEWVFVGLQSLGWHSVTGAAGDLLRVMRNALALYCSVHTLAWALACLDGWFFGRSLTAHPEWWTDEALWLSATLQAMSVGVAAVVSVGLPLTFARASHKTRSQVLDWLFFITTIVVAIATTLLLRIIWPDGAAALARLGDQNGGTLTIPTALLVADWARALGRRRLDSDDAPEHAST